MKSFIPIYSRMGSASEHIRQPCLSFGAIADVQYADTEDGYNFTKTNRRYFRTALTMLHKAINVWNTEEIMRPRFVLQLGDAIDGRNEALGISESSLATVLRSFSLFDGPVYHIWGNHEYYNFTRQELLSSKLFSGNAKDCIPVKEKAYYSCIPHQKLRILALDCYEISMLASPKDSDEYVIASQIMQNNNNEDKNSCAGMIGEMQRYVKFNGGLSKEQIDWMERNLKEARSLKQNIIIMGHCGIYEGATDNSCLCWNAPEVLTVVQNYSDCVLAYLSGHDHAGGMAYDSENILHMAFPGVLENNVDSDFGTFYLYNDELELKGNGRVQSLSLPLRFKIDDGS